MPVSTDAAESGATLSLAPAGSAPSQARQFVAGQLRQWQLQGCEDTALLLVSELVTNAILHARTDIVVGVIRDNGSVLVEVTDGSATQPTPRQFSVHAGTGRGLTLVAALASKWGVRRVAGGKTVWASLSTEVVEPEPAGFFDIDAVEAL
jgi:anti-sigma regulatory factor (Ser/Thr protein kinase)